MILPSTSLYCVRSRILSSISLSNNSFFDQRYSRFHASSRLLYDEYNNPRYSVKREWSRAWDIFEHDWRRIKRRAAEKKYDYYQRKDMRYPMRAVMQYELWPIEADFFIVGGGLMGSCAAWWLKQRARDEDCRVVVVESDETVSEF